MNVNFNNVRKNALDAYKGLIETLNLSLCTDVDYTRVIVPVQDIQRNLDKLRDALVTIGCTYEKDDPDFKCIIGDDEEIPSFNPEDE